ncbi:hypothetical protein [Phenylobacterium sp.]|uniref:hypothetical protein n=1 Tax=Phenylobacterium sp. TaxID=1871053 RepID=UPI0035621600
MTRQTSASLTAALIGLWATAAAAAQPASVEPLMRYNGDWAATVGDGKITDIDNRCTQDRAFITCEQVIDGKPTGLLVFLPVAGPAGTREYLTTSLSADGSPTHPWSHLTIAGEHWVFHSDKPDADGKNYSRVINDFSGPTRIHYEIQSSEDGRTWATQRAGDERKIR